MTITNSVITRLSLLFLTIIVECVLCRFLTKHASQVRMPSSNIFSGNQKCFNPINVNSWLNYAPLAAMVIGILTIIIAVLVTPLSSDDCPCHWMTDFREDYTTLSILVEYQPMKNIINVGFGLCGFLVLLTASVAYELWYARGNHPIFSASGKQQIFLFVWLTIALVLDVSLLGNLFFNHSFNREIHVFFGYMLFISMLLMILTGNPIVQWEAERLTMKRRCLSPQMKLAQNISKLSIITSVIWTGWYFVAYTGGLAPNEGTLALSEHLLIVFELSWLGSVYFLFKAENIAIMGFDSSNIQLVDSSQEIL